MSCRVVSKLLLRFPIFRAARRQALDVVSKMLAYDPLKRIKPLDVCSHEFVDEVGVYYNTSARLVWPLSPALLRRSSRLSQLFLPAVCVEY